MTKDALPPAWTGHAGPEQAGREDGAAGACHSAGRTDSLKKAMRRARGDNAERAGVTSDLRAARLGRLELLHEALKPLLAQIPAEVDTFDVGLLPGSDPRLFIDMIGFVEMGRDTRLYRLLQDTRTGRIVLKESEEVGTMVDAVTDYVARRLLEREKALAADTPPLGQSRRDSVRPTGVAPAPAQAIASQAPLRRRSRMARGFAVAFSFLIDLLGSLALFTALAIGLWYVWTRLPVAL